MTVAILLLGSAATRTANAQNLLANPDFSTALQLAGWSPAGEAPAWDQLDGGAPTAASGSARLTSFMTPSLLRQCVAAADDSYRIVASVLLASGSFGRAELRLRFHSDGGCNVSSGPDAIAIMTQAGEWTDLGFTAVAPPGTHSISAQLGSDAFGMALPTTVYFDDVELPEPEATGPCALAVLAALRLRRRTCLHRARGAQQDPATM